MQTSFYKFTWQCWTLVHRWSFWTDSTITNKSRLTGTIDNIIRMITTSCIHMTTSVIRCAICLKQRRCYIKMGPFLNKSTEFPTWRRGFASEQGDWIFNTLLPPIVTLYFGVLRTCFSFTHTFHDRITLDCRCGSKIEIHLIQDIW